MSATCGNLFDDVKHKLKYRMRLVHAHFLINANVINGGKILEIRNYLGEKIMHTVNMLSRCLCGEDDWRRLLSNPSRYRAELTDPF